MTSEIDKLKHFHVENWDGTNFADDLNDGEEDFIVLITVLELLKIQKLLYLKMVDLLVILV